MIQMNDDGFLVLYKHINNSMLIHNHKEKDPSLSINLDGLLTFQCKLQNPEI